MSEFVPEGWAIKPLSVMSSKISDGIHSTPKYTNYSQYPFINGNNLKSGKIVVGDNAKYVCETEYLKHKKSLDFQTILMSINGTIGNLAYYQGEEVVLGKSASYISLSNDVSKEFIYYSLSSDNTKKYYDLELTGSTISNLSLRAIKDTPILTPPLPEQQKIAAILTSVDEVIEKTQAQINKLKDLKTGMMQELLTRGVGVDGKPHTEFKESPVGRIPKAWEVLPFSKVTEKIQDGTHFSPQSKEGPCLYLTSKNIQKGKLLLSNISYISQEEHDSIYKRCDVKYGDVLLTKDGANTGNCAMNTLHEPFSLLSSVAFLRCDKTVCLNDYLYQFMSSSAFKKVVQDSMTGNAITRLTLTIIKNLKIAVPSINEQSEITKHLSSVDSNLELKHLKLESLKSLKKALMQDLLTGKVRVKVDRE